MPSNAPRAATAGRSSGGKDRRSRRIRMKESLGLHSVTESLPHAQQAVRPVDAQQASRARLDRDRLPVDEGAGTLRVEADRRQRAQRGVGWPEPRPEPVSRAGLAHLVPRGRFFQRIRSDAGAHERGERGATAESGAEVRGERAHVGALAAADPDHEVGQVERLETDAVDPHLARLPLDLHPLAGQLVEPLAAPPQRRVHGRDLADDADEGRQGVLDGGSVEGRDRPRLEHRGREILALGGDPQPHGSHVLLVEIDEIRSELGGLADQDREQPGGGGIERAAVADPGRAEDPAQVGHHLERRHARPLLDRENAGAMAIAHDVRPSRARLTAASMAVFAWSSGPGSVQPAAFWWPPPPNWWAIRFTGTSPFPRRLAFTRPPGSASSSTATFTPAMERG